jgi:trk system potassium uptake protein TrkH
MSSAKRIQSLRWVAAGYGSYVLLGWLLLSLPVCAASERPHWQDNLFIALSAVSTTGLTSVPIDAVYSTVGHVVILGLIQAGGIGYMTIGSFVILASRRELPETNRDVTEAVFDLPEGTSATSFIRNVILFTLGTEAIGAGLLWWGFARQGVSDAGWQALFHSISAFCTAGFSLFPNSLQSFQGDPIVTPVIAVLSLIGAAGFLVVTDFVAILRGGKRHQSLTTKVILAATVVVLVAGTCLLLFLEPSYRELTWGRRFSAAAFQTTSALATVGFETTAMASLSDVTAFLLMFLMVFGSSPSGTGGGIRITAVAAAASTMWTTIRKRPIVTLADRKIPQHRIDSAFVSITFYLTLFLCGSVCLLALQPGRFREVLFEVVSAVSTVGLSQGITAEFGLLGKSVLMLLMFVGRVGPITLGSAAVAAPAKEHAGDQEQEEDLAVD